MANDLFLLFTDETNKEASERAEFFIYGGVVVPATSLSDLHTAVSEIRLRHGFKPRDSFEFASNTRPDHVPRDTFTAAKSEVMERCSGFGLEFIACLTLHEIARNKTTDVLVQWGANTVFGAFDEFLLSKNGYGAVVMDRLRRETSFTFLREKFQTGLTFPNGRTRPLSRIHLFATSCDGASHAMSAIDILLGGLRYCVNERQKNIAPRAILGHLAGMIWGEERGGKKYVREKGIRFRPKRRQIVEYEQKYAQLVHHLQGLIRENDAHGT